MNKCLNDLLSPGELIHYLDGLSKLDKYVPGDFIMAIIFKLGQHLDKHQIRAIKRELTLIEEFNLKDDQ